MKPVNQQLPAGLLEENLEIFAQGSVLYALYNGTQVRVEELPAIILDLLADTMEKDASAVQALNKIDISEHWDMLRQYLWCNFGGWNREPDYEKGKLMAEYWDCGCRGACPFEGKICKAINHEGEIITPRELEIIKLIAAGLADKQIADKLNIAYFTVTKHRQNIERKLNARSKVDVANFASRYNLSCSPDSCI